jgi:hypothetical protein
MSALSSDGSDEEAPTPSELLKALAADMKPTFPELDEQLDAVLSAEDTALESFVVKFYPRHFFDVLYRRDDVFESQGSEFMPGVDMQYVWGRNISSATRDSLWKHFQLILFAAVSGADNVDSFGDAAKLFEAVDESHLREKLQEVVEKMTSGGGGASAAPPDAAQLEDHLNSLLGGRIGRLAREIADEALGDFGDMGGTADARDAFTSLIKDPLRLMRLVKRIGDKIDKKIKSGELKETELLEEASELLEKMKTTPGMEGMQEMMAQMGINKKRDVGAARAQVNTRLRTAKTKDRLREKLARRRAEAAQAQAQVAQARVVSDEDASAASAAAAPKRKRRKKKKKNPPNEAEKTLPSE